MLDGLEKKLNASIHEELQAFNRSDKDHESAERLRAARRLSQLYWELIYQGLVQGDLARHSLEQSLHYTQMVLAAHDDDAALHLQHGRLLHAQGRRDEARSACQEALGLGMPLTRVVPYLAELAYETRDYEEVRRLMTTLQDWQSLPRLQPLVRYWGGA